MSSRFWVTSSLARRPEIFCWVFRGRTPLSLMLFVGHTVVSSVNSSTSQRPLRLHGPDRARVALGAVLKITQQVRQARLVPGDVLPPGIEVVLVAVGDHDPGEARQDPGVLHRVQAPGTQPEGGVPLGE